MSKITPHSSHEALRAYIFGSPDRNAVIPKGMYAGSGSGPERAYSGREAIGNTSESFVVLCLDEQLTIARRMARAITRKPAGRTALLHILTPSENDFYGGLGSAQDFDVNTLVIDDRTTAGLVAAHKTYITPTESTRSGVVMSHIAYMSGDSGCPDKLRPAGDLVDLDWREAYAEDFDLFASIVTAMKDEYAARWARR